MFESRVLRGHSLLLAIASLVLALACGRQAERPLSGAPPVRAVDAQGRDFLSGEPPPTLTAPFSVATQAPAPLVVALASPSPSPALAGRNPLLSSLLPSPDAQVPPGPVNIGGRVAASSDLVEVVLMLDGASLQPRIAQQDPRTWLVGHTSTLEAGKHEVRLTAKDRDGRAGGYRWQFSVQPAGQAPAVPSPKPR